MIWLLWFFLQASVPCQSEVEIGDVEPGCAHVLHEQHFELGYKSCYCPGDREAPIREVMSL